MLADDMGIPYSVLFEDYSDSQPLDTAYEYNLRRILKFRPDIRLEKLQKEIRMNWHRCRLCLRLAEYGEPMPWEPPVWEEYPHFERALPPVVATAELQEAIIMLQRVRPDLDEKLLMEKSGGDIEDLEYWENLALAWKPMPWEPEKDEGEPMTAEEAFEKFSQMFPSRWQRVKNFFNRRIF